MRKLHKTKEIEEALQYAEAEGWTVEKAGGSSHAWESMWCPFHKKDCRNGIFCRQSVWSTPQVPENHARALRRVVDNCIHRGRDAASQEETD